MIYEKFAFFVELFPAMRLISAKLSHLMSWTSEYKNFLCISKSRQIDANYGLVASSVYFSTKTAMNEIIPSSILPQLAELMWFYEDYDATCYYWNNKHIKGWSCCADISKNGLVGWLPRFPKNKRKCRNSQSLWRESNPQFRDFWLVVEQISPPL